MREFDVDKYLGNSFFRGLIEKVYNAKEGNDLMNALTELDRFVSKECEIAPIRMVYEEIEEYGIFRDTVEPYFMSLSQSFSRCEDNFMAMSVYFHEKRHQLQYLCYKENDLLFGKAMNEAMDIYLNKYDACAITKFSFFSSGFGYYCRPNEQDAYKYEKKIMVKILEKYVGDLWSEGDIHDQVRHYTKFSNKLRDPEFIYLVENHIKIYPIRKRFEEELLEDIKEKIKNNCFDRKMQKIMYGEFLQGVLNDAEKEKIKQEAIRRKIKIPLASCDENLLKIIHKTCEKIERKKTSLDIDEQFTFYL